MPVMLTYITGVGYKKGAYQRLQIAKPKEVLQLIREPLNPYDKNAVAIYSDDGIQLGYVPACDAKVVSWALALELDVNAHLRLGGTSTSIEIEWDGPYVNKRHQPGTPQ